MENKEDLTITQINRKDLILLLLGISVKPDLGEGINGITRLQKFIYLLEREENLKPNVEDGFDFIPYKAGPYSAKLYDDLEFLENLGLLTSEVAGEATEGEAAEVDLTFEDLMGDCTDTSEGEAWDALPPDVYEEHRYRLTKEGRERVEKLIRQGKYELVINGIRKIKSKFGGYSLNDLLYYVYTKYDDMATESEIKDKILRRGQRR